MIKRLLLLAGLVLFAAPAWAVTPNAWTRCGTDETTPSGGPTVALVGTVTEDMPHICFKFDEGTLINAIVVFDIKTDRARCNLERDLGGTAGSLIVAVRACGASPSTRDLDTCGEVVDTLNADEGVSLTRGEYAFVVTTAVTAGEDAVFSCRKYN